MFVGNLMDGEKLLVSKADVDLVRRSGSELGIHDGVIKVPKSVGSSLQVADWSIPGAFPSPPFYILDVPSLPSEIQRMSIFINRIEPDANADFALVKFLTQISDVY